MNTLKSSDLGGRLEKKKEEENYDLIDVSLYVGLLMFFSVLTGGG